jgi:hypothetical protein
MNRSSDDSQLDARSYTRSYRDEVDIIVSAVDCVLNGEKAVYASSDLTTGRQFYRLLREWGARDSDDLRGKLGDEAYRIHLLEPNTVAANAFARRLRERLGGNTLVMTPAPLLAPGWSQQEYLAFFETLIRTRVKAVFLNEGWEYSNGCTFEFAVAQQAGVPTFDADHTPIDRARGMELIELAARELEASAIEPIGLRRHQALVQSVSGRRPTLNRPEIP